MRTQPHSYQKSALVLILLLILSLTAGLYASLSIWPALGAQGADLLRAVLGDEAVARLEMLVFNIQDQAQQWQTRLGLGKAEAPWQIASMPPTPGVIEPATAPPTPENGLPAAQAALPVNRNITDTTAINPPTSLPPESPVVTPPTSTSATWQPYPVTPLGSLAGEGVWTPYLKGQAGQPVAYRTFLQPDAARPYAVIGVVAFNLDATRLHYVLGSDEPYNPAVPKRSGKIHDEDLLPGRLLATFNGGFKATHGQFGAMADGLTVLPPRNELGTIAIYSDGSVRIGNWGVEISPQQDFLAWRQNGPLVVYHGKVNDRIYNNSPKDWGYTVTDVSPTWRSGLGISEDGKTLYYFAGPKLTLQALANSMLAVKADSGIQLDINNYWVHFTAIRTEQDKLLADPLFPEAMSEHIDRYLHPYTRDYFYITTLN